MRRRTAILGLLAIWGVFALAGFRGCSRPTPDEPSLLSTDPSEVSQAYWLAARRVSIRCAKTTRLIDELIHKAKTIESVAERERVWTELAQSYSQAAAVNSEGIQELKSIPQDRVDPIAVECVTELTDFLSLQANLFQRCSDECIEMASLFAFIRAEGAAFDSGSPKGIAYANREAELISRMRQTLTKEGAVEKQRLKDLAAKASASGTALARKHRRDFLDLLGH